jgi:CRP/FNR family transcriptional regulator, anaerobic regulatory protein
MYTLTAARSPSRSDVAAFWSRWGDENSLQDLFEAQQIEILPARRAAFRQGDAAEHAFQVATGVLRLCRILPDGRRAIAGLVFPGDIVGLSFPDQYPVTAEAASEVLLRRLSRRQLEAAAQRSAQLRSQLFDRVCEDACGAQDRLLLLHMTAEQRVSSFLLFVARKGKARLRRGAEIDLPMSRGDVADYLGLKIETVCRTLAKLRARGLIAVPSPHQIVLLIPSALMEVAGEADEPGVLATRASPGQRSLSS